MRKHDKLYLITLNRDGHLKTCNYWYLIQSDCMAHTAFTHRAHMLKWLEERNLKLTEDMPDHGVWSCQPIAGEYIENRNTYGLEQFHDLPAIITTRAVDNGEYTMLKITDDNGIRTEHVLNCNCKERPHYDYFESREMVG